jgi:plastocyanin domain-containing protein
MDEGRSAVTWDKVVVNVVGLLLIAFIVWFFWLVKVKGVKAALTSAGYQEQLVLVKGGYTPDVIVVERGKPVRLNFVRQESASCSEMVLLPAFNKSVRLPEGVTVPVEFLPAEPGEYEFACQMGMFRGRLIVEP